MLERDETECLKSTSAGSTVSKVKSQNKIINQYVGNFRINTLVMNSQNIYHIPTYIKKRLVFRKASSLIIDRVVIHFYFCGDVF